MIVMYKPLFISLFLFTIYSSAIAQKWQPGYFNDVKGNKETGFIRVNPSAHGPIKDEGFIEFKESKKANPIKLSASDLQSFIIGQDSFVVAHAPKNQMWSKKEFDFVKVVLDEDIKLYAAKGGSGRGGHGLIFEPGIGIGAGTGGYGSGIGGGVSGGIGIPIGGGGDNGKTTWYFGTNTAEMRQLTDENFEDVMSDMMGDEADVVDKIHTKVFVLANIDKLVAYFKQQKAADRK